MRNPSDLYSFGPDANLAGPHSGVLLVMLGSFIDAGQLQQILSDHLIGTEISEVVATFDVDQVYDYRGRRPMMVFDTNKWQQYEAPSIVLRQLTDRDGQNYFLLTGPEPDYQWERVVESIRELIDTLGIDLVVTVHGIPMGVPHTRPVGMTAHATSPNLIRGIESPFGRVQVPASLSALMEVRLGDAGHDAAGFAIHVPHYLAASEYPQGALSALNAIVDLTGLNLPNDDLIARAEVSRRAIISEMEGNEEVQDIVAALEQQYDAFMRGQDQPTLWAPDSTEIPSADQLGAEFENFLRNISDDDTD